MSQLWDIAEGAVRKAWESGKTAATELLNQFHRKLQELDSTVGSTATAVKRVIGERLNQFFTGLVSAALERYQPKVTVAGRDIVLRGVTIEQTVQMSGSLKASLEDLCEFVAGGSISISAEYGPA